jgi:hypothetical protein
LDGKTHSSRREAEVSDSSEPAVSAGTRDRLTGSDNSIRYSFSGHETFPFRYTWPPKGIQKVKEYPDLFSSDDAMVVLGVGKNMVRSIRHWCETLGLIESPQKGQHKPTDLGDALFSAGGWDPYLEDIGTLWLLHWQLTSRWTKASTWYLAFTQWNVHHFSRDVLVDWLLRISSELPTTRVTRKSMQRDVDIFLRTYVPSKITNNTPPEDSFDCPLVELGLIAEVDRGLYQFVRGPKPSLPEEIFLYALLDFWEQIRHNQRSLSFETALHGPGSPGGAFKLSENFLIDLLERLPIESHLIYDDTAGMRTILRTGNQTIPAMEALRAYYGQAQVRRT